MSMFWVNNLQSEVIAKQIAEDSNSGKVQREFIQTIITEFESSEYRTFMDVAWRYYKNQNDVLELKRTVIGRGPENNAFLMESKVLSNNKLCHNFMKKLTRQKIGYMLSKPFTLSAVKADDTTAEKMFEAIKDYFKPEFYKMLKNVARDSIVKAMGWLHVYYDEEGQLSFKRCAPEEIIPLWADSDHTKLDAVIRQYFVEQYKDGTKEKIKYVDYYTLEGIYSFIQNKEGKLVPVSESNAAEPHFKARGIDENGQEVENNVFWARIPFIPFKYDPDEQSLLTRVKTLIDDYDKKTSEVANSIDDFPNSITVVKNYDGASKEEFVHNKNQYRTIFVQGDGDAKSLETKLNIAEIDVHLERLRQDIYEFGQGVNTADKDIRDTSGVALRFIYADLDMDCLDWGSEVDWSIRNLIWFIQQDIIAKQGVDYSEVEYGIIFDTDVIINESETIQNCFVSNGLVSKSTIAANHPWVLNAEKEVTTMLQDEEVILDLETEYAIQANKAKPAAGKV